MGGRRRALPGAAAPRLLPGELHVWAVPLTPDPRASAAALRRLLPAERAWARRLRAPEARDRHVRTRAALRALLGAYLGLPPSEVALAEGSHGKPRLRAGGVAPDLHFNVSHSGSLALLAFSLDGALGVDLERVRPRPNALALAERFFAPRERGAVRAARGAARTRVFLALWTAKEAVLKARGDGLAGLGQVEVRLGRGGAAVGLEDGDVRWQIRALRPGRGWIGAIAARGLPAEIRLRRWRPRDGRLVPPKRGRMP